MTNTETIPTGTEVICNGYRGVITGEYLPGMYEVRLGSGGVVVPREDLRFPIQQDEPVKTYTRAAYARMRKNHYAGTAATRDHELRAVWTEQYPDWNGRYWGMWFKEGCGTVLGPINVH